MGAISCLAFQSALHAVRPATIDAEALALVVGRTRLLDLLEGLVSPATDIVAPIILAFHLLELGALRHIGLFCVVVVVAGSVVIVVVVVVIVVVIVVVVFFFVVIVVVVLFVV